jgi:hypothetical protein
MTYIQLVNAVLVRLRESSVATVTASTLSTLISKFVNEAKQQVEDAWAWEALLSTITLNTESGTTNYVLTGAGERHKLAIVNDSTNKSTLQNVPIQWILKQQQLSTVQYGNPIYYAWAGSNGTDSKVEIFPTPNGVASLKFNMYVAQADLSADSDILLIQSNPVILLAYAKALVERGEDGGLTASEAYGLYKIALADQISIESARNNENDCWVSN